MRALVQEPMKARSMAICSMGVPALRSMYSRARSKAFLSASLALGSGKGTVDLTPVTMPGRGAPGDGGGDGRRRRC